MVMSRTVSTWVLMLCSQWNCPGGYGDIGENLAFSSTEVGKGYEGYSVSLLCLVLAPGLL